MQAALQRQKEVDQTAAASATGGGQHRLAEAAEAVQAQERLERAPRFRKLSEAIKLVQQHSWFKWLLSSLRGGSLR